MPEADLLSLFVRPLNQLGWAYAVTGAVGTMFYAEPRFTNEDVLVCVAPPEYVVLRKLAFYREGGSEKHVRDIRGILALADPPLDRDLLLRRLTDAGLDALFRRLFP